MKISFYIAQMEGKVPNQKIWYTVADTYEKANKVIRGSIDKKTYSFIKALEDNKDFELEVKKIRTEFNIPIDGYSFDEWTKYKFEKKMDKDFMSWRLKLRVNGAKRLVEKFNIPYLLQDNLVFILLGNYIYIPLTRLYVEAPNTLLPVYDGPELKIVIQSPVSKNQLIKFINENWITLEKEMVIFGNEASTFVSERDRQIITLRDEKKYKFREIADLLMEETDNFDINEDMVKRAYHRAKSKIDTLIKR